MDNLKTEYRRRLLERYIVELSSESKKLYQDYLELYDQDLFSKNTTTLVHDKLDKPKEEKKTLERND